MDSTVVGTRVFAVLFGAGLLGVRVRAMLPEDHLRAETKDGVKVGMGLVEKLSPQNDVQRSLKSQAAQIAIDLGQMRWLLFEQTETSISLAMLIVLISWLAIIFMSAGLFAPPNATVIIALMLAALSIAGAIFLILELDSPFDGVIQISQRRMRNALIHLGH